jgi:ABC-2 type transport system ATP-binding protein
VPRAAIEVSGLRVVRSEIEVLRGIDLDVEAGAIYGLLGPSGAGKTTLIRCLMGLQRHEGSISVLGERAGSPAIRGRLGYMAQAGAIYPDLSVLQNLRFFAAVFGAPPRRVHDVVRTMRLDGFERRLVAHLSGGQQRRVSLGCAIIGRPGAMMLDEPTVGLDPVLRKEFWEGFHRWASEGATIVVSSHVMDEAERCDRLVLLRDGRLLATGSPRELLERTGSRKMEDAFLRLAGERTE